MTAHIIFFILVAFALLGDARIFSVHHEPRRLRRPSPGAESVDASALHRSAGPSVSHRAFLAAASVDPLAHGASVRREHDAGSGRARHLVDPRGEARAVLAHHLRVHRCVLAGRPRVPQRAPGEGARCARGTVDRRQAAQGAHAHRAPAPPRRAQRRVRHRGDTSRGLHRRSARSVRRLSHRVSHRYARRRFRAARVLPRRRRAGQPLRPRPHPPRRRLRDVAPPHPADGGRAPHRSQGARRQCWPSSAITTTGRTATK